MSNSEIFYSIMFVLFLILGVIEIYNENKKDDL
jgi:hypothetical protein